jgi:hypothetical protein
MVGRRQMGWGGRGRRRRRRRRRRGGAAKFKLKFKFHTNSKKLGPATPRGTVPVFCSSQTPLGGPRLRPKIEKRQHFTRPLPPRARRRPAPSPARCAPQCARAARSALRRCPVRSACDFQGQTCAACGGGAAQRALAITGMGGRWREDGVGEMQINAEFTSAPAS